MQKSRSATRLAGAALALVLGVAGPAAAVVQLTDTYTPASPICLSTGAPTACNGVAGTSVASANWLHDILDDLAPGDVITGAQLTLTLDDDGGPADGSEKLGLTADGVSIPYAADANHDAVLPLTDLTLLSDGTLAIVLSATRGDFLFGGSTLTVWVERAAADTGVVIETPMPAPSLLLGAGLLLAAVASAARRRAR
ncbi:MAG TPA: hypothetical protein VNI83_15235 [Vicinamibacterales bacterium]|nr:hypothetical protein [Vicinamibacterales bacterium]